jgi:thioredoxin-dependent peroxiredoxin
MPLQAGDQAPAFSGITQTGDTISLADFAGKTVVLYFYPKDDTPGCTKEACSLRDNFDALLAKDVVIIGVSPDSSESHTKFIDKFTLPFDLIADTDKTVIETYGAWGKKMYGRLGVLRHTYVIGPDGVIIKIFKRPKTDIHGEQILDVLP